MTDEGQRGKQASRKYPVVLVIEEKSIPTKAIAALLLDSGFEPAFATTVAEVERELKLHAPAVVLARRDGPVPIVELAPLVHSMRGKTSLRVISSYAGALVEEDVDERLSAFLFESTRFFVGLIATAGQRSVSRTETVARLAERTARRLGLKPCDVEAARLAALFGDFEEHAAWIANHADRDGDPLEPGQMLAPLLDPEHSPYPIRAAIEARREHFDGTGPSGLKRFDIPPAARVLAVVDATLDLKADGNRGDELETRLRELAEWRLDPRAVEAVLRADRAERLVDRLHTDRDRVLVIDPDPVAASLLQMRLVNAGFDVEVHGEGESALAAARAQAPSLVVSEVGVPLVDGFSVLLRMRKEAATEDVPFVFVTERNDRGSNVRGLELGADDYLTKPVDLELLVAKLKSLVRKVSARRSAATSPSGGVSGSLAEMGLVDLLQVLSTTRRTVRIIVQDTHQVEGDLCLVEGNPVDATFGEKTGVDAFNALIALADGHFTVQASEASAKRTIDAPLQALLLDACRRQDEAARAAASA